MSSTKTVRNADFYLGRLKDLPAAFLRAVKTLKTDTVSKRILPVSVLELCHSLGLEYDKFSFENDRKHAYAAMGELLEHFELKLVPCSIPVDLEFTGTVFLTSKPNLANDEDIALVRDIIASGRNPRQSDYVHILRMNEKLANYNIMLRVFEALFCVAPGRLAAHQRVYLNSLLGELILPIEGLSYLRACFTYAIEVRNCHCDYTDKKSCFKDLDADKVERECLYLSEIGARGAVRQCQCQDFPFAEKLNASLQQAYLSIPGDELMLLEGMRLDESPSPKSKKKYLLKGQLQALKNGATAAAKSSSDTPAVNEALADACVDTTLNDLKKGSRLPDKLMAFVEERLRAEKYLACASAPDFAKLRLARIEGQGLRPAAFLYCGYGFPALNYWPFILCTDNDPAQALGQPGGAHFARFLKKPALPLKSTDEYVQNELQLCRQIFFALIIEAPLKKRSGEELSQIIKDLKNELAYAGDEFRPTLCAIYALHRVLTSRSSAADARDPLLLNGLYAVPALLTLYLVRARLEHEGSPDEFLKRHEAVLRLRLLQYVSDRVSKLRRIRTVKNCGPEFIEYALGILKDVDVTQWFGSARADVATGAAAREPVPCPDRIFQDMLNHPFVKTLTGPLLERDVAARCGLGDLFLKKGDLGSLESRVLAHAPELIYLNTMAAGARDPLASMLCGRISDSEMSRIRLKLLGTSFASAADLSATLSAPGSRVPDEVVTSALRSCALLQVPLDAALPRELRQAVQSRGFIDCPRELLFDESFMGRLGAAQLALIVYREITPGGSAASVLARRVADGDALRHKTAADFLKKLEDQSKNLRPVGDATYVRLYENSHHLETFSFFIACLKQVMRESLAHSVFAVYEQRRFAHIFTLMHQKLQDKSGAGVLPRHGFDNLDLGEISSKISESREAQSVISRLVDEGERAETGGSVIESAVSQGMKDEPPAEIPATVPDLPQAAPAAPAPASSHGGLSEASLKLIVAVAAQRSDMMDRREFDGLCMSMGFMSGDAAIEEINDVSYEECGEPLFESAPEEQAVYISCDLLENFLN